MPSKAGLNKKSCGCTMMSISEELRADQFFKVPHANSYACVQPQPMHLGIDSRKADLRLR